MQNIVLTNKPNKRGILEKFIRSRGISNFIVFTETADIGTLLSDMLVTSDEAFNLHVFDYFGDLSITNTIRDYRDQINLLRIYVTSIEDARPYLTLTDDVFVMPNEYNVLMYFWDSDACRAKNVSAFDLMNIDFFKVVAPTSLGKTNQLAIDINTQKIPLKYRTASGSIVETTGPQIVVTCKAKSKEVRTYYDTRQQEEVYRHYNRDLADLPAEVVEQETPDIQKSVVEEPKEAVVKEKPKKVKPEKAPVAKPEKSKSDKRSNGFSVFFSRLKQKDPEVQPELDEPFAAAIEEESEIAPEPEATVTSVPVNNSVADEPKHEVKTKTEVDLPAYIGFNNVKSGKEAAVGKASSHRFSLAEVYDSISQYCIEKKYIDATVGAELIKELAGRPSRDAAFGNIALERGYITEDQLIEAITQVNHIEVLSWDQIESMELDFTYFSSDKCREFKFFKLKDKSVEDTAQIVCAFSLSSIHPEVRRLFDNPRIQYTLDTYITRKLESET